MEDFDYSPFKDTKAQIRLVELYPLCDALEPHQQQQELRCTIKTINLRDKSEYTALSYSWGSPNRRSRLIVDKGGRRTIGDDATIRITKSLEVALLHLRDPVKTRTLWIDQLCINQEDLLEKSVQVPLMKTIYENAADVLVWLGPTRDESNHLLRILDEVGKQVKKAERLYGSDSPLERTQTYNATLYKLRKRSSLGRRFSIPIESLRSFVEREWWTRVWVVQEISVATSVIFACGDERITYEHLRNALLWYASDVLAKSKIFQSRHWLAKLCTFQTLLALQKAPYDSAALQMVTLSHQYKGSVGGFKPLRILNTAHVARHPHAGSIGYKLQATNDKDKIYGLLGLIEDKFEVEPDYQKEVWDVYIDAARELLKHGYMDMLWYCQFPKSNKNEPNLPSWTPDWSGHIQEPYGTGFSPTSLPFAASGEKKADISFSKTKQRHITLKGVSVDKVDEVGQLWGEVPGLDNKPTELNHKNMFLSRGLQLKAAMPFLEDLERFFDSAMGKTSGPDAKTIEEARWRTPIGDREMDEDGGNRRATAQSRDTYIEIYRRIEIKRKQPVSIAPRNRSFPLLRGLSFVIWAISYLLVRSVLNLIFRKKEIPKRDDSFTIPTDKAGRSYINAMQHMHGRRPFRTQHGYVGLGPAGMKEDDRLCILFGAQVPYVLRPNEINGFHLVGEAYVHGIMNGEFLEEQREEETFTLS